MLAKGFDFTVENQSGGASLIATVYFTLWRQDATGAVVYHTEQSGTTSAIADAASAIAVSFDNGAADPKWMGGHGRITFDSGGGTGNAYLYLVVKSDGTNAPNQLTNMLVSAINPATKSYGFEF